MLPEAEKWLPEAAMVVELVTLPEKKSDPVKPLTWEMVSTWPVTTLPDTVPPPPSVPESPFVHV